MLDKINERIVADALGLETGMDENDEDDQDTWPLSDQDTRGGAGEQADAEEDTRSFKEKAAENSGQLLVDATCAPADIPYPTDVNVLNEAREKSEEIIDILHAPHKGVLDKPRTYRECARKEYLHFAKKRKPNRKNIRKAIRKQLGYLRRNLAAIKDMAETPEPGLILLSKGHYKLLLVINEVYRQQRHMYDKKTHKVGHRIVNIYQPHVRPIVRGKAGSPVEFGAKITISQNNGLSFVDRLNWEAYNESGDLIAQIERYKKRYGSYPKSVHADKIYRTRANRKYCKKHGIRLSGPKLGRPPKETEENKEYLRRLKQQQQQDERDRQAVEGKFGQGKRRFRLDHIMTKLAVTSETTIMVAFIVMNIEKIFRDLLFVLFLSWSSLAIGVWNALKRLVRREKYWRNVSGDLHVQSQRLRGAA
jgi:hypothetical protein